MAAPSTVGSIITGGNTSSATLDLTITPDANANGIFICFGGFMNASGVTVTSVQGDPTGTPYDLDDVTEYLLRSTQQYSGIYAIFDDNANWPGTGSAETIRITLSAAPNSLRAALFCLQDMASSSQVNSTNTGSSSSGNVSLSLSTSTTNALDIGVCGTYSADVSGGGDDTELYHFDGGAGDASVYVWTEAGASSSNTIEPATGTVAYSVSGVSIEGTAGGGGGGGSNTLTLLGVG